MAALASPPSSPLLAPSSPDRQRLRLCQALLPDELTLCNARNTSGRFCTSHGKEYKALTKAYKDASETAAVLRVHAALAERQIRALRTVAEVDQAITAVDAWHDAVADEMRGRRAHHSRFFDTKDEGHERRLERLAKEKTKAERLVERLVEKRQYVAIAKDKHRRRRSKSSIPPYAIPAPVLEITPRPRAVYVRTEQQEVSGPPVRPPRSAPVPVSSTTAHAPYAARPTSSLLIPTHDSRRERELAASVRVSHTGPLLPTHIPHRAPLPPSNSAQSSARPLTTAPGPRYGYGAIVNCPDQESPNGDGGDKRGFSFLQKLLKGVMLAVPFVWLGYILLRR